jgi:hypothetical protein
VLEFLCSLQILDVRVGSIDSEIPKIRLTPGFVYSKGIEGTVNGHPTMIAVEYQLLKYSHHIAENILFV